jgi:spore coat protein U-like protein
MFCHHNKMLLILMLMPLHALWACSLDVSEGINFGVYNPFSMSSSQSLTQFEVTCPEGGDTNFTVTLDTGSSGQYMNRTLINSSFTMNYNLYTDPGYGTIWGDGVTDGTASQSGTASDCVTGCEYTVYGLAPANQISVGAGMYTDTVNVTLSF